MKRKNPLRRHVFEARNGVRGQPKRMSIVMFMGRDVNEYWEMLGKIVVFAVSEGQIKCQICLRSMKVHSYYCREIKETGEWITIAMVWCEACREWHALLPDFLLQNKHYSGNEVESVVIDSATETVERIETAASESTVRRWIKQIGERIERAVGILKYLFGKDDHAASEIKIDPGPCYSELEQVLEMAPKDVRCSGNKLGLANIWLGTNDTPAFI
jgi:hypothetical protein